MRDSRINTPYAETCRNMEKQPGTILCGASSMPGSNTLQYFPRVPESYKFSIKKDCATLFVIPIIWKGNPKVTPESTALVRKLTTLPLCPGSSMTYMPLTEGYFFNLILENDIRITISQYEDKWDEGVYVNVILNSEPVIQDFMSVDDLIASMMDFYHGSTD